jgi:leucine dehydrogenase
MLDRMRELEVDRVVLWRDARSGLEAILVIDDVTLGPAAGGVRTKQYLGYAEALADAAALARAMTLKCALAGLQAGGGKCVVLDHAGLDRARAFAILGERVAELRGLFRTAGDLGTTAADLAAMATKCPWVHTDESNLAASVARGLVRCAAACAQLKGRELRGLKVAVQGAGSIGAAVAAALLEAGADVTIADIDDERAKETHAKVARPEDILTLDVDIVAPCAVGGVIDTDVANKIRAWAVCGAANNVLASPDAEDALVARDILVVPDVIASAGAVIEGIGRSVMDLPDRTPLIDALGDTARAVLTEAQAARVRPTAVAERLALARIHG